MGDLHLGRTIAESTPEFHPIPTARAGSPNVLVVVLDDLGFGQLGCFGSDLRTPTIDALAAEGLRYNRFHVTALCSPTRACLLTGRNHHAVGMGFLTDIPTGFPGYDGRIPRSAATMPRLLRDNGWSTYAVGKWHLAPRWEQSASGPFSHWPLGLGFERYYGFLAGDTNQWTPDLVSDNGFVDAPGRPEDGYHLTEDLADRAIRLIQDQQQATPGKPFFLYLATGAMHAPHHVPRSYADAYAGAFDDGWEAWRARLFERQVAMGVVPEGTTLPARPPWIDDWASLPADQRRLYARFMEVFAGFLTHTDEQLGRLFSFLSTTGVLDDTLVMVFSDNGTSAEGGPQGTFNEHRFTHDRVDDVADTIERIDELGGFRAYNHYPWGWAWAGNTPLRLWKRYTWLGGVRTPLVVRWPTGIAPEAAGSIRSQFAHAVDLLPTVLDACGLEAPTVVDGVTQQRFAGRSLRATFGDPDAPAPRNEQYFEMLGSRAIYLDGWKATTDHVGTQISVETERLEGSREYAEDHWALFDLSSDFAEAHDRAADEPERLARMVDAWWHAAGANQVLPLEDGFIARAVAIEPNPFPTPARRVLRPGGGGVNEDQLGPVGAGFRARAVLPAVGEGGGAGILFALGDWSNGFAWYLLDGRPVATFNLFGAETRLAGAERLEAGPHVLGLDYDRPGGSRVLRLLVDDEVVAETDLDEDLPFRWQIGGAGLRIGEDAGFPVCDDYETPFPLTGATLDRITIDYPLLGGRPDPAAEVLQALRFE